MASKRGRPPHPGPLTPAEARVLALVREGLQNSEIAITLGVSINTVRFHVSNLLAKSGVPDRVLLRNWEPDRDAPRRRLPALPLPFLKPLGMVDGGAGAVALATLAILAFGGRGEDPAVPADEEVFAYPGGVVGMLTRQPGGLVVTEPGGFSYKLTAELTFARWVDSQVFILGQIEVTASHPSVARQSAATLAAQVCLRKTAAKPSSAGAAAASNSRAFPSNVFLPFVPRR